MSLARTFGTTRWVVLASYVALVGWNLFRRDPTFDELQAWGIARASRTPLDLVYNTAYEGRFPLWHFVLWLGQRISTDLVMLRTMSLLLAAVLAILVLATPRTPAALRIAMLASFPVLVGMTTFSRDYVVVAIAALAVARCLATQRWHLASFALATLALVNLFGLMVAGAMTIAALFTISEMEAAPTRRRRALISVLLLPLGASSAAASRIAPPVDSSLWGPSWSSFRFDDAALTALDGWSSVLAPVGAIGTSRLVSLGCLLMLMVVVYRAGWAHRAGAIALGLAATSNFVWGYFAGWWHAQQIWIGLIALLLVEASRNKGHARRVSQLALAILVALQFLPHHTSIGDDVWTNLPTSNAASAAEDARSRCIGSCVVVADTDLPTATLIAAHLGHEVVAANIGRAVWFATYDSEFRVRTTWSDVVRVLQQEATAIAVVGNAQQGFLDVPPPPSLRVVSRFDQPTTTRDAYLIVELVDGN